MAIEVQQDKKNVNILNVLMGVVIVGVLFAGVYFFLFRRPEYIEVVLPGELQDLDRISNIQFQPDRVFESLKYKVLQPHGGVVNPPPPGRRNPFERP